MRPTGEARRQVLLVLGIGGFVVLGLVAAGVLVWLRRPAPSTPPPPVAAALSPPAPRAPARLEPSLLLAEARRQASAWHRDAVLVSVSVGPLDAGGVATVGKVEIAYAEPSGERISGGAEAGGDRLVLSMSSAALTKTEVRATRGRIAPEPNCVFEDAWEAAQRAGQSTDQGASMLYFWSDEHGRPIWEVVSRDGQVQRRLDGVTCSILTR
jgi:hypothetical protein